MIVAQFDILAPQYLIQPLRNMVLRQFEKLVRSTSKENFITVYATVLILLNLITQTCQDDRRRQQQVSSLGFSLIHRAFILT